MAGLAMGGRPVDDSDELSDYAFTAEVAFAFAEEVDTIWGSADPDYFQFLCLLTGTEGYWSGRDAVSVNPVKYQKIASAIVAIVREGDNFAISMGVDPGPWPPGGGSGGGTSTTANFTVPAYGATVVVPVTTSKGVIPFQTYAQSPDGQSFIVVGVPDSVNLELLSSSQGNTVGLTVPKDSILTFTGGPSPLANNGVPDGNVQMPLLGVMQPQGVRSVIRAEQFGVKADGVLGTNAEKLQLILDTAAATPGLIPIIQVSSPIIPGPGFHGTYNVVLESPVFIRKGIRLRGHVRSPADGEQWNNIALKGTWDVFRGPAAVFDNSGPALPYTTTPNWAVLPAPDNAFPTYVSSAALLLNQFNDCWVVNGATAMILEVHIELTADVSGASYEIVSSIGGANDPIPLDHATFSIFVDDTTPNRLAVQVHTDQGNIFIVASAPLVTNVPYTIAMFLDDSGINSVLRLYVNGVEDVGARHTFAGHAIIVGADYELVCAFASLANLYSGAVGFSTAGWSFGGVKLRVGTNLTYTPTINAPFALNPADVTDHFAMNVEVANRATQSVNWLKGEGRGFVDTRISTCWLPFFGASANCQEASIEDLTIDCNSAAVSMCCLSSYLRRVTIQTAGNGIFLMPFAYDNHGEEIRLNCVAGQRPTLCPYLNVGIWSTGGAGFGTWDVPFCDGAPVIIFCQLAGCYNVYKNTYTTGCDSDFAIIGFGDSGRDGALLTDNLHISTESSLGFRICYARFYQMGLVDMRDTLVLFARTFPGPWTASPICFQLCNVGGIKVRGEYGTDDITQAMFQAYPLSRGGQTSPVHFAGIQIKTTLIESPWTDPDFPCLIVHDSFEYLNASVPMADADTDIPDSAMIRGTIISTGVLTGPRKLKVPYLVLGWKVDYWNNTNDTVIMTRPDGGGTGVSLTTNQRALVRSNLDATDIVLRAPAVS
jgi:hypothetical protein